MGGQIIVDCITRKYEGPAHRFAGPGTGPTLVTDDSAPGPLPANGFSAVWAIVELSTICNTAQ